MADGQQNEGTAAAVQVLGYLGAIFFAIVLVPQIALNQKRRSTDGLSLHLVLLWHAAALLYLAFIIQRGLPVSLAAQQFIFSVASIVVEVQVLAFRHNATTKSAPPSPPPLAEAINGAPAEAEEGHVTACVAAVGDDDQPAASARAPASRSALVALGVASTAASALGVLGLVYLFRHSPSWVADVLGSALCSILIVAGYLPQIALMCKERSSAGFSLGLSALDSLGGGFSIAALLLTPWASPGALVDPVAIIPYAVIVGFQVVVVVLAVFVFPDPNRFSRGPCGRQGGQDGGGWLVEKEEEEAAEEESKGHGGDAVVVDMAGENCRS